jgi:hypothetical protein
MKRVKVLNLGWALFLYFLIVVFPGFLCSHFLRLFFYINQVKTIGLGISAIVIPYMALALLLLQFTQIRKPESIEDTKAFMQLLKTVLFILFIFTAITMVKSLEATEQVIKIWRNEIELPTVNSGWETVFGLQLLTVWISGCFSGIIALLVGYLVLLNKWVNSDPRGKNT